MLWDGFCFVYSVNFSVSSVHLKQAALSRRYQGMHLSSLMLLSRKIAYAPGGAHNHVLGPGVRLWRKTSVMKFSVTQRGKHSHEFLGHPTEVTPPTCQTPVGRLRHLAITTTAGITKATAYPIIRAWQYHTKYCKYHALAKLSLALPIVLFVTKSRDQTRQYGDR